MQLEELDLHVEAELLVKRAEGLVEQQNRRPGHQRTGKRHALALAAAQLMDAAGVFVLKRTSSSVSSARARRWSLGRPRTLRPYSTFSPTDI